MPGPGSWGGVGRMRKDFHYIGGFGAAATVIAAWPLQCRQLRDHGSPRWDISNPILTSAEDHEQPEADVAAPPEGTIRTSIAA